MPQANASIQWGPDNVFYIQFRRIGDLVTAHFFVVQSASWNGYCGEVGATTPSGFRPARYTSLSAVGISEDQLAVSGSTVILSPDGKIDQYRTSKNSSLPVFMEQDVTYYTTEPFPE